MMLFGTRTMRGGRRAVHPRVGTLLAFLALFSQIVISVLPMPAMAKMLSPLDDPSICHFDNTAQKTVPKPGKSSGHAYPDCPVCQAAQLLGSLTPPAPIALPQGPGRAGTADFVIPAVIRPHRATATHQARAPPPLV